MTARLNGTLPTWDTIAHRYTHALLTGNGSSLAVSREFGYSSLYQEASIRQRDRAIFDALDTTNFELVLDSLRVARVVCTEAGHASRTILDQARRVRRALVNAVADVHPLWINVPVDTFDAIRSALRHYEFVFTTNYDLLHYWAIMSGNARGFRDYFWGPATTFDLSDTQAAASMTKILYLHGALHLFRDDMGRTQKRTSSSRNLLQAFATASDVPLFVSEGRSRDKLAAIRRNDYLAFGYELFANECESLVIFGHSLGDQDAHLRSVVARRARRVAVAVRPGTRSDVRQRKAQILASLPDPRIDFFDAESHPLGDPDLAL